MSDQATARSGWRFFPLAVVGGLGLVVAVNGAMIWQALATFPGKAGRDGFALSNRYNMVLQRQDDQAAIGWVVRASVDAKGRPAMTLADADGAPMVGATIDAVAERPVGEARSTPLRFIDHGAGQYVSDVALGAPGQWDVSITAQSGGRTMTVTRRVHVP
jgi:nitrogen fixation protein FixH